MFSGLTLSPDSKEAELEIRDEEVSTSVHENTGAVSSLVGHGSVPLLLFGVIWILPRILDIVFYGR